jgi:hypothetical protein
MEESRGTNGANLMRVSKPMTVIWHDTCSNCWKPVTIEEAGETHNGT